MSAIIGWTLIASGAITIVVKVLTNLGIIPLM